MSESSTKITNFSFGLISKRLKQPYVLSFRTIKEINSFWVYLEDDKNRKGIGEAVPLLGYGSEDESSIEKDLISTQTDIIGKSVVYCKDTIKELSSKSPFAASAVGAAIDFLSWGQNLTLFRPIDLVFPITANSSKKLIMEQVNLGRDKGFRHYKVKIGKNIEYDIETAKFLLLNYPEKLTFRFDANQAYNLDQCRFFAIKLKKYLKPSFLWLEQPLPLGDWEGMRKLCSSLELPFMLDESIYCASDIKRAKKIGCKAIKLKLFKHPGLEATLQLAKFAASLGLTTTLGNGVSSDIGNLGEAMIFNKARDIFIEGAECNGFTKIISPNAFTQLGVNNKGQMIWNDSKFDLQATLVGLIEKSTKVFHKKTI